MYEIEISWLIGNVLLWHVVDFRKLRAIISYRWASCRISAFRWWKQGRAHWLKKWTCWFLSCFVSSVLIGQTEISVTFSISDGLVVTSTWLQGELQVSLRYLSMQRVLRDLEVRVSYVHDSLHIQSVKTLDTVSVWASFAWDSLLSSIVNDGRIRKITQSSVSFNLLWRHPSVYSWKKDTMTTTGCCPFCLEWDIWEVWERDPVVSDFTYSHW